MDRLRGGRQAFALEWHAAHEWSSIWSHVLGVEGYRLGIGHVLGKPIFRSSSEQYLWLYSREREISHVT